MKNMELKIMIKAIYILNTAGKVRLVRVFDETVSV